jgi:hypothetical protein
MPYPLATPEYPLEVETAPPEELSSETVNPGSLVAQTSPDLSIASEEIPLELKPPPVYPFVEESKVPELDISIIPAPPTIHAFPDTSIARTSP